MVSAADIEATVAEGRAEMESLMLDRCRITRPTRPDEADYVPPVLDETTGQYPTPARVVVYEGKCRIQVKADINSNVVETTAGEREWTYLTMTLQLPVRPGRGDKGSSEAVRPDNILELTRCCLDPDLEGRLLNIQGTYHKSQATHRRFRVRELIG
jgi:hypothetical protein